MQTPRGDSEIALWRGLFELAAHDCELSEKRRLTLQLLSHHFDSVAAVWSWGVGDVTNHPVMPVAMIDWGMSQEDRTHFIHFGLHPQTDAEFRLPIQKRAQSSQCVCTLRQDLFSDQQWPDSHMRTMLRVIPYSEWLHAVNHPQSDQWSMIMLFRSESGAQYDDNDRQLIERVMQSVPWFDADRSVAPPEQGQASLTARQRTVMLLLLDGQTRKAIAGKLAIHEDTVGDHIKAVFKHFGVRSVTELAALFLQSK